MRIFKISLCLLILALITGCSCTAKRVGANVPYPGEGGPLQNVNFAFDSYELDSIARAKLDSNIGWLNENSGKVTVEGHCDERGTNEYNMALGLKRARAVYNYYVGSNVDSDRLSIISYGEELPLDPGHNEAAWSKNRRAHSAVK